MYRAEVLCLQDAEDGNMRKVKYGFKEKNIANGLNQFTCILKKCMCPFLCPYDAKRFEEFGIRKSIKVILSILKNMGYSEDFIPDGMNAFERNVKRIGDCIIAGVLLLIFSPLFLICYLVVKREDGGPAIFKQERVGRFGRPFYIYKFRSMRLDAESMGPQLYKGGRDPRLTKVGKFLREHHLDELPQLWNVFCGDMAFYRPPSGT